MRRTLTISIAVVYATLALMFAMLQEDTFLYNMLSDSDCFTEQHVQYEDGSCLRTDRGV